MNFPMSSLYKGIKMKKLTTTILALAISASMFMGIGALADSDIRVCLNGQQIQFEQPPVIQNERTLVPVRAIFEAMGMSVSWNETTKKILAVGDSGVITMEIGTVMLGYGSSENNIELHPMDVAPCIINDSTYVPARFIAEATGYNVDWDASSRTVVISGEARKAETEAEEYIVKGSLEYYETSVDVVDYGKLNNTECKESTMSETECTYKYNTTGEDFVNYVYAIKAQGYEMDDTMTLWGLTIMTYKKGDRTVNISYDKSDKIATITLLQSAMK